MSQKTGVAPARDRLRRRIERERRADHLVAGPDPERLEHEDERIRAVRDSDRIRGAEEAGGLLLERPHFGPEDELPESRTPCEALLQLLEEGRVLRLDVDVGDSHGGAV